MTCAEQPQVRRKVLDSAFRGIQTRRGTEPGNNVDRPMSFDAPARFEVLALPLLGETLSMRFLAFIALLCGCLAVRELANVRTKFWRDQFARTAPKEYARIVADRLVGYSGREGIEWSRRPSVSLQNAALPRSLFLQA